VNTLLTLSSRDRLAMNWSGRVLAVASCLAINACHGGGGAALPPGSGAVPQSAGMASMVSPATKSTSTFHIVVPAPMAGRTSPQSLVVTVLQVNGATLAAKPAAYVMNLTASTPGCTAVTGGALSCNAVVVAPVGTDTFSLSTYAGQNGSGAQIATSQAKAAVKIGGSATTCTPAPKAITRT
jgi:hypothetical protein